MEKMFNKLKTLFPWIALVNAILILGVTLNHFILAEFAPLAMLKTLSYFTIQTNLLTAIWELIMVFSLWTKFKIKKIYSPTYMNILFIHNLVTLVIYFLFLSSIDYSSFPQFNPFWDLFFMHYISTVIYLIGYFLFFPRQQGKFTRLGKYLIYVVIYYGYSYLYQFIYHEPIYPFLDVELMGGWGYHLVFVGVVSFFVIFIGWGLNQLQKSKK